MGSYFSSYLYSPEEKPEEKDDSQQVSIYNPLPSISTSDQLNIMKLSFFIMQGIAINRDGIIYITDGNGNWEPMCHLTN